MTSNFEDKAYKYKKKKKTNTEIQAKCIIFIVKYRKIQKKWITSLIVDFLDEP